MFLGEGIAGMKLREQVTVTFGDFQKGRRRREELGISDGVSFSLVVIVPGRAVGIGAYVDDGYLTAAVVYLQDVSVIVAGIEVQGRGDIERHGAPAMSAS